MNCIDEIEGLKMIMDGTIHMAPKQSQVAQNQMRRNMGDYAEVHGPHRANRGYSASLQPLQVHNGLSNPPRASTLLAPKQSQVAQNQMRRNMGDYAEVHGPYRANRGYSASLQPLQVHNGLSNPPRASTLLAPKQSQVAQNQMRRNMGDYAEVHGPYRANRGYSASLQPLQVHNGLSNPPRASTLRECELIIRQLYNTNHRSQSQQIVRYKELLEDIVLNKRKRITPENYNLTKAFLADDIWTAVGLPALTQGLNSSVAERQRRNRAVHRSHVKGTVR
ncbi:uncharacterized protein LOC133153648 isoform X2 [Syngnathus typhle]|uniref:uncharacterized protein LOC133153648 isoform X2 n=1 Tax=Syngnathus typhle TaxID=161592 RepID=UPI002A6A470C|nr:uncharacterized protein LOC133153648 isoform X2 [Syngnathus typhle]